MPESEDKTSADGEFARLVAGEAATKPVEVGQVVKGRVVQIGEKDTFLDIGGKSEAAIATAELQDESGVLTAKIGDLIEATVVKAAHDELRLTRKLLRGSQVMNALETASRTGIPVQGKVAAVIKGGFEVNVLGQRAFCPLSQIDLKRAVNPASYVGQLLDFRVIEFRERGKNIVVSRRKLLEAEAAVTAKKVWEQAAPGAVLTGTVVSLADFGAFVDLGGVQGLIHISEISHERITKPSEHLAPGQTVTVKVLKVDTEKGRISLSLKALADSPWETTAAGLKEGDVLRGRLVRVVDFGAFVEVAPGVDGLIHVSQANPGLLADWKAQVASRPEIEVRVLSVDRERKRISLAPVS
jgi:small subunit ribosomal protein S1